MEGEGLAILADASANVLHIFMWLMKPTIIIMEGEQAWVFADLPVKVASPDCHLLFNETRLVPHIRHLVCQP